MSVVLYRKYRSKSLDEIVGQTHVTDILTRSLKAGTIAHAYLLTGPRGVGKTSIARILAHEINGLDYTDESEHLDIIEIDAASNNGVDDVRELRDKALIAPSQAKKKVYIIDEVHMLSRPAFNALLKILEEPPEHIVFILATTDFDKLPDTIVSRTQRFHFRAIATDQLTAHLSEIAQKESISIEKEALELLGERSRGSLRDGLSMLDQVRHSAKKDHTITQQDVEYALGLATSLELSTLFTALQSREATGIISSIDTILERGVSAATVASQLVERITRQLADHPQLVHLLEGLMQTPKSSHPDTKLLVTLLADTTAKPKNIAHIATQPAAPHISAPVTNHSPAPTATPQPPATSTRKTTPVATPPPTPKSAPVEVTANSTIPSTPYAPFDPDKFDWNAILTFTQQNYTALYAILSKCTPQLEGDQVILYTGRKFNKTKLDSAKYRPLLSEIFAETGAGGDVHIETIGSTAPPKDSKAAEIAAMMGGGEEVDV